MKFEEALVKMREGLKITHPLFKEDEYFQACLVGLKGMDIDTGDRCISIVKMKGDCQHPDMFPNIGGDILSIPCKHGNCPQLNLFLVMSEEWKIVE